MKKGLKLIPVNTVDEVIEHALVRKPTPIEWIEPADVDQVPPKSRDDGEEAGVITH